MKNLTAALACGLLLLCGAQTPAAHAQKAAGAPALTAAQWREDLRHLARELPKRHKNLFHNVSREQFERSVAELDEALPSLEAHRIVVGMLRLTAKVGDGHTTVVLPQWFDFFPARFYWFGDELRVTHIDAAYKEALGARVVAVGGLDVKEAKARLTATVLSEVESRNEWYVLSASADLLSSPEVLHAVGVTQSRERAPFTFEDDAGRRFTLELAARKRSAPAGGAPAPRPSLLSASKEEPLYRQSPGEEFRYVHLPESRTVYVAFRRYPKCGVVGGCEEFDKLLKLVDESGAARLVIDLRANYGGDSTKVRRHLIPALLKRPAINRKGGLYVITGRRTFSAALWNAIDFKKQTNATIVGEPPGEQPNSYSENDELTLPNSRLLVSYSTKYYKFLDEDVSAFMPDKLIPPDWPAYKAGRDPVMEWILSDGG